MFRMLSLCLLALGVMVCGVQAEDKADANTHVGKLVKITGNKLTMSDKEGKTETTHTIAPDAKITCDGKACTAADLKPGVVLIVTTKPGDKDTAIKVDASTKDK
jgi:hypothetical protein